ncbi:MAG: arginine repressor [Lachnospiraceae bacterium]|nr:arginine repressor [Lachnospiraceae bacterium]
MKRIRQSKILELIDQYEIETQEDLGQRLLQAGFRVTQATISRDIRELALTKVAGSNGRPKYAAMDYGGGSSQAYSERYARVLQDGMVSITQADNLVVIRTVSGMAMAVAAAVDALGIEEIAGSIAGDDTIMCAVKTAELVPEVIEKIRMNQ